MAYFLGLFGYGPNPSAALVRDGALVAFAEEERFNRIKTAPNSLPLGALLYCLKQAGIGIDDVEAIGFGWDCERYVETMPRFYEEFRAKYPSADNGYNALQEDYLLNLYHPTRIRTDLVQALALRGVHLAPERIGFLPHHLCHAASTYYCSGFAEASVLTLDGSGEEFSTFLWHGRGDRLKELRSVRLPHSLGGFYATFTEFLGFKAYQDEGKLMGLAPYGRHSEALQKKLDEVLPWDHAAGEFQTNPYMRYLGPRTHGRRFTDAFVELFGRPRLAHQPIEDRHRDLAFNVKWRLEQIGAALVRTVVGLTGSRNLCLAGGVAMNCCMNGKLSSLPEVERIFVQPASADNGIALGAAYALAQRAGVSAFEPFAHAYWGPEFSDAHVEAAIRESKLPYEHCRDTIAEAARLLAEGKILGWFQGRMEIGARALGNRSILANPSDHRVVGLINRMIKNRDFWMPFAPTVLAERASDYLVNPKGFASPYMMLAMPTRPETRDGIAAAIHPQDGTARPQILERDWNPEYHAVIREFERRTGVGAVLNTSFNLHGEPIVRSAEDAVDTFERSGLPHLAVGRWLISKK